MRHRFQPLHPDDPAYEQKLQAYQAHRRGKAITFGILLVSAGAFVLLHRLRVVPDIHRVWPYALMALGLVVGLRSRFQSPAWWILLLIGAARAIPPFQVYGDLSSRDLVLPLALLGGGAVLLLRSQKKSPPPSLPMTEAAQATPFLDVNTVFSGRKEIITTKNFGGGTVSTVCGGTELNLMQADAPPGSTVTLTLHVLFGGVELIIPSHWSLQNTVAPVFGGLDDRRVLRADVREDQTVTLILKGSCVFGGVEVKSY